MNYENQRRLESVLSAFGNDLREILKEIPDEIIEETQEIRLRSDRPIVLNLKDSTYFLSKSGEVSKERTDEDFIVNKNIINTIIQNICSYSIYSHQEEIKKGFVTIKGGHRVGICGSAVLSNGSISSIKDISSVNIRLARQKNGVAKEFFSKVNFDGSGILIVGPPSSGKTTILRDVARSLSIGKFTEARRVSIIDERGEIACVCNGEVINDVGLCDVLDGYPKGEGIMHALRSLAPEVIVCDEIGNIDDICAIEEGLNAGVSIIATVHAKNIEELLKRKQVIRLLDTGAFSKIVLLKDRKHPSQIENVYEVDDALCLR